MTNVYMHVFLFISRSFTRHLKRFSITDHSSKQGNGICSTVLSVKSAQLKSNGINSVQEHGLSEESSQDTEHYFLRSATFQPREEINMPYNDKVHKWLESIFLEKTVEIYDNDSRVIGHRVIRPYPVTFSETASANSSTGKEEKSIRCSNRKSVIEYRTEFDISKSIYKPKFSNNTFAARSKKPNVSEEDYPANNAEKRYRYHNSNSMIDTISSTAGNIARKSDTTDLGSTSVTYKRRIGPLSTQSKSKVASSYCIQTHYDGQYYSTELGIHSRRRDITH